MNWIRYERKCPVENEVFLCWSEFTSGYYLADWTLVDGWVGMRGESIAVTHYMKLPIPPPKTAFANQFIMDLNDDLEKAKVEVQAQIDKRMLL